MPNTLKLREQRANIWEQMKALVDSAEAENRDLTAEERQSYDRMESELDSLADRIERGEAISSRSASFSRDHDAAHTETDPATDPRDEYSAAFSAYLRNEPLSYEQQKALQGGFDASIRNAAGVSTGAAGGYTVPPEFRDKFIETQKWYGPMLREAEVIYTDSGANFQWPTNDDTANVGAILGENTQVAEQDFTFGTASIDAYMYTSKLVRASLQFLQDNAINADAWVPERLGVRCGRILNQHFTTGTGTAQPDGIVTGATVGATSTGSFATTGGITYDSLVDLVESLDPAYGGGPGLKFMAHQTARKAIRKLKDGQSRPLWEPSLQVGQPDSLLGYPFVLNNDMATMAQSSKSLGFGNIRQAYVIRIVKGLTVLRLVERYADYLQVGFLGFERADGTLQDSNAFKVHQTTATA